MAPVQVEKTIEQLHSTDFTEREKSIHKIKNLIIGNKPNKTTFIANGAAAM